MGTAKYVLGTGHTKNLLGKFLYPSTALVCHGYVDGCDAGTPASGRGS